MKIEFNMAGWNQVVHKVIDERMVPNALEIAAACNAEMRAAERGDGPVVAEPAEDEYVAGTVSVDGGDALQQKDYRATVITRTRRAMRDNAIHQRLVNNLYLAEKL